MNSTNESVQKGKANQNIQVYLRVRPVNARERLIKSNEMVEVHGPKDVIVRQPHDSRQTKKFSFDKAFGMDSQQHEVYKYVVSPLIQEVLDGYNCTVFAYGQTGTGKTFTMVGEEQPLLTLSPNDPGSVGMIPRALSHLFDNLRSMNVEFAMRVSYLELYNEELCDLLSTDDNLKIKIFDDVNKKGSVIVQGLEEIPVRGKDDVYKLLAKGQERRKTAATLMNAQSSRSHTVFSILVHIKENGVDGEELLKIGKLNLVDLAGSENISKAGNEKGIRTRESVNINQSLLTLGRVITALVERAPHIPYRESKLTRLLQESLGGRTKTSIIATVSCGHKDLEETLSTLDYAHRAKNIQNKPEINQRLSKKVILKEYTEEIEKLKRDLNAARERNGIFLAQETFNDMIFKTETLQKELNEHLQAMQKVKEKFDMQSKEFDACKISLDVVSEQLTITEGKFKITETELSKTKRNLKKVEQNYTEAKQIINCHQDTEQQLFQHAKEIIQIADEASNDTKFLQENIKRRKEKDEKALTSSNNLINSLSSQIFNMKNEVQHLETAHKESSGLIVSDLEAHMSSNKDYSNAVIECLKELNTLRNSFKNQLFDKFEKWIEENDAVSKQEFQTMSQFIRDAQEKEEIFIDYIEKKISNFMEILSQRKEEEIKLKNFFTEKINEQKHNNNEFSNYMQMKFDTYQKQLISISSMMKSKNDTQRCKLNEMKKLLQEIEDISEQNTVINKEITDISHDIEGNGISVAKKFIENTLKTTHENEVVLSQSSSVLNENFDKLQSDIKTTIDFITNGGNEKKRKLIDQSSNVEHVEKKFKQQFNVIKEAITVLTNEANAQNNTKEQFLTETVEKETSRSAIQIQEIKSVVQHSLHSIVNGLEEKISESCVRMTQGINEFRNENVFAYKSTGETPARKEYKFNRQLTTTSPHDRIIRRYRLEQGLNESSLQDISILEEEEINSEMLKQQKYKNSSTPLRLLESQNNIEAPSTTAEALIIKDVTPNSYDGKENQENDICSLSDE